MKKLRIFLLIAITAFINVSCEDDKDIAVLDNEGAVPSTLITPADGSAYVLSVAAGASDFETFAWTESDYGPAISRSYSLEMDLKGGDFVKPVRLIKDVFLTYTITNAELNLILYDAGVTAQTNTFFRIMTTVKDDNVDTLYSPVNGVSLTPFAYNKPNFSAPVNESSYVLTHADSAETFETFVWSAVDYGAVYANKFTLEFDIANNDFKSAVKLASTENLATAISVDVMNEALIKKGIVAGVATDFEFRIVATADGKRGVVKGDPITLSLTSYSKDVIVDPGVPSLYLVGNATLAGWVNTAGIELKWDEANQEYSAITDFIAGGMKILEVSGQWAPQWGDDGTHTGILTYRPDEATADPAEITSPGVGSYKIRVDIVNLTYSFEAQ